MKSKTILVLKGVSKKFSIAKISNSFLSKSISFFTGFQKRTDLWILKNISLSVQKGDVVGIIGKNGSGKTTLLRIIAGMYKPTSGSIICDEKFLYLSNLSSALKQRLSTRDNIYLRANLLGVKKEHIEEVIPKILDFSGLQEFSHLKVFQLSSGMRKRLLTSMLFHLIPYTDADILLLDEILKSGGDIEFRKKSEEKIASFIQEGKTIIMVSHDLSIINKYCKKVFWIDNKHLRDQGEASKLIESYIKEYTNEKDVKKYLRNFDF